MVAVVDFLLPSIVDNHTNNALALDTIVADPLQSLTAITSNNTDSTSQIFVFTDNEQVMNDKCNTFSSKCLAL